MTNAEIIEALESLNETERFNLEKIIESKAEKSVRRKQFEKLNCCGIALQTCSITDVKGKTFKITVFYLDGCYWFTVCVEAEPITVVNLNSITSEVLL